MNTKTMIYCDGRLISEMIIDINDFPKQGEIIKIHGKSYTCIHATFSNFLRDCILETIESE